MLERLFIVVFIITAFVAAYYLFKYWQLKQVQAQAKLGDALMNEIPEGQSAILYFTAEWCSVCKLQQQPAMQQFIAENPNVKVVTIDIEVMPEVAQRWHILSLPTTIILDKKHVPIAMNHGAVSARKLAQQLKG
ncbi:MAG: hypothetical protein CUN55_04465 [Phototrophicales bacterium]|nr:MAG: hypothetical protein CUN55_04465 [Phototrophicales bacterium]